MRRITLLTNLLCMGAVYTFACGALNLRFDDERPGKIFLERLLAPLGGVTPLTAAVLTSACILFTVSLLLLPSGGSNQRTTFLQLPWSSVFNVAFLLSSLVVSWVVLILIVGAASSQNPKTAGVLFAVGVWEALLGGVLAVAIVIARQPTLIYLPALGFYLLGTGALGFMFWIGCGVNA